MSEATPDVEQLMDDYEDVWNGDFSKLEVVSESVDVYDPAAPDGEVHGRGAFQAFVEELRTGFPDMDLTIDEWIAEDDVVMGVWSARGTHDGEFNGVPPTERSVEITGMARTKVSDSKIQEDRIYWDRQEMFEQLGLTEE